MKSLVDGGGNQVQDLQDGQMLEVDGDWVDEVLDGLQKIGKKDLCYNCWFAPGSLCVVFILADETLWASRSCQLSFSSSSTSKSAASKGKSSYRQAGVQLERTGLRIRGGWSQGSRWRYVYIYRGNAAALPPLVCHPEGSGERLTVRRIRFRAKWMW